MHGLSDFRQISDECVHNGVPNGLNAICLPDDLCCEFIRTPQQASSAEIHFKAVRNSCCHVGAQVFRPYQIVLHAMKWPVFSNNAQPSLEVRQHIRFQLVESAAGLHFRTMLTCESAPPLCARLPRQQPAAVWEVAGDPLSTQMMVLQGKQADSGLPGVPGSNKSMRVLGCRRTSSIGRQRSWMCIR